MSSNPYAPPKANVEQQSGPFEVPHDVLGKIKAAAIAGVISGCITLLLTLIATFVQDVTGFIDAWTFLDVLLIFGLTFGIYKKSRSCAVVMLVYFVCSKIYVYMATGKALGLFFTAIFLYYYFRGVQGTFAYHKLRKQHLRQAPVEGERSVGSGIRDSQRAQQ